MDEGMRKRACVLQQTRRPIQSLLVVLLAICLVVNTVSAEVASDPYLDAYEQLRAYGFPVGLLPDTVKDYSLEDDGNFAVHLKDKCSVMIPGEFPVLYSQTITGTLSYGTLRNLSGISVKAYFFWWSLTSITVTDGNLVFEVGLLTAKYPMNNFEESPSCVKKSLRMIILDE